METILALTGNSAAALAMKQIEPDVCAAYPITPSTQIMEEYSQYVADGAVQTELILVESEHSAMSACIGASAAGGRAMTATSANGLAFMWEVLYIAAGMRLPIVMVVGNRALSGPINIHCDHSDAMGARDSGWIQLYCENAQEVYDTMIQALRIAEDMRVRLPVMVCMDGFIITHAMERVEGLEEALVKKFVGNYTPYYPLLDVRHPVTYGALDLTDYYMEHKRQQVEGMKCAKEAILDVGQKFGVATGRSYGLFTPYRLDDADLALLIMGSSGGTAQVVVDELREEGMKVGLLKLRSFRPFPGEEVAKALAHVKALAVLDRSDSPGSVGGPLFTEVRSALFDLPSSPQVINLIYGLGGREFTTDHVKEVYDRLATLMKRGRIEKRIDYLGLRE